MRNECNIKRAMDMYNIIPRHFFKKVEIFIPLEVLVFADRVHVSNHQILVQALPHTPIPNYDMP